MVPVLADPALYAVIGGAPPTLPELTARYERQVLGHSADGRETWHNWVLRVRATGAIVGFVQATVTATSHGTRAELAWLVGVPWWGQGLASEAAAVVVPAVTGTGAGPRTGDDAVEVIAHIAPGHAASETVAARIGLSPTGIVHDGEIRWSSLATPASPT